MNIKDNNNNYENLYKDIIIDGEKRRFYSEMNSYAELTYWIETQYKWKEFIEKYNFNIFFIKTEPKNQYKFDFKSKSIFTIEKDIFNNIKKDWSEKPDKSNQTFKDYCEIRNIPLVQNDNDLENVLKKRYPKTNYHEDQKYINLTGENTVKIKNLQSEDLYYLYINILYEVLYFIPKYDENGNYYYELIIIINKNTDLKKILNYNFNLIKIINFTPINLNDINAKFIEKLIPFEKDTDFNDNMYDINIYNWFENKKNFEEYKLIQNPELSFNMKQNLNYILSNKVIKKINWNLYANTIFRNIIFQVFSFDRAYVKLIDKYGMLYNETYEYGLNYLFVTDYYQLMGAVILEPDEDDKIITKPENLCQTCMADNYDSLIMNETSFSKEYVLKNCIDFDNIDTILE